MLSGARQGRPGVAGTSYRPPSRQAHGLGERRHAGGAPARPAAARAPAARRSRPRAWRTSRAAARPPTAPPAVRGRDSGRAQAPERAGLWPVAVSVATRLRRHRRAQPGLAVEVGRPHTVLDHSAPRGAASLQVCRGAPPRPRRAAGRRRRGRRRAACAPPDPQCTPRAPGTQCPPPPGSPRAAGLPRNQLASHAQRPEAPGALAVATQCLLRPRR